MIFDQKKVFFSILNFDLFFAWSPLYEFELTNKTWFYLVCEPRKYASKIILWTQGLTLFWN